MRREAKGYDAKIRILFGLENQIVSVVLTGFTLRTIVPEIVTAVEAIDIYIYFSVNSDGMKVYGFIFVSEGTKNPYGIVHCANNLSFFFAPYRSYLSRFISQIQAFICKRLGGEHHAENSAEGEYIPE